MVKLLNRLKGKGKELFFNATTEGLNSKVCIGLNWSGIPKKGTFNKALGLCEPVDLDGAMATYKGKELDEVISYKRVLSNNGSMRHSGDDRMGDLEGNDGLDNETMVVDLDKIQKDVDSIYVYMRSVKRQDFADIPYSILRIIDVMPGRAMRVISFFNLSQKPEFRGTYAILMGKFEKQEDMTWTFTALGVPLHTTDLKEIGLHIGENIIQGSE